MPRASRQLVGLVAVACAALACLTACSPPPPRPVPVIEESEDGAPPDFGMQGDRFYNAAIGYSFSVPDGWVLHPGSDPHVVLFGKDASGATFAVMAGPAEGDTDANFARVEERLAQPGSGFTSVGRIDRTLDGRRVPGVVSTGTASDGEFRARNWVVVEGGNALILGFEAPPAADHELEGERAAILDSFRFGGF